MAQQEIQRLNSRIETLANRPTHLDLLADFETNFDRAILSMGPAAAAAGNGRGGGTGQSGGEATTSQNNAFDGAEGDGEDVVSSMLLTELAQAKEQCEHLERMNEELAQRAANLERIKEQSMQEKESSEYDSVVTILWNLLSL